MGQQRRSYLFRLSTSSPILYKMNCSIASYSKINESILNVYTSESELTATPCISNKSIETVQCSVSNVAVGVLSPAWCLYSERDRCAQHKILSSVIPAMDLIGEKFLSSMLIALLSLLFGYLPQFLAKKYTQSVKTIFKETDLR